MQGRYSTKQMPNYLGSIDTERDLIAEEEAEETPKGAGYSRQAEVVACS